MRILLFWGIFILTAPLGIAQTMQAYEYWFDNYYESRTTVMGSQHEVSLDIDIRNVHSGLHYFNFRALGNDNKWGCLSRFLVCLSTKSTYYEYWLDNDYAGRTIVNDAPSSMLNVDISDLSNGLHFFNIRYHDSSNRWGSLYRYLVYINNHHGRLSRLNYWIDDNIGNLQTILVDTSPVLISIDISRLTRGNHKLTYQGITEDGRYAIQEILDFVAFDWEDAVNSPKVYTITDDNSLIYDLSGRKHDKPQENQVNIVGKRKILFWRKN